ncbi:chemotaxis protein CheW [Gammaproteobacteria bacterium AH-315-C21]|nr:chemotaxis protein CheW [Gammaproteobacteria bacterium AH-315-C21]
MERLTHIDPYALAPLVTASGEDCWNQNGVWGQQTPRCPRLQEVIHCRNCDVFAQAGRRLFESAANIEYVSDWAEDKSVQVAPSVANSNSYTVFRLGNEWLAVATGMIREISEMGATHRIPHRNQSILRGLMSLYGQLVPWISLEGLMGITEEYTRKHDHRRCIVIEHDEQVFVFSVMQVQGLMRIAADAMREVPAASAASGEKLIMGVTTYLGHDVGCLDGEALVKACNGCFL